MEHQENGKLDHPHKSSHPQVSSDWELSFNYPSSLLFPLQKEVESRSAQELLPLLLLIVSQGILCTGRFQLQCLCMCPCGS